MLDIFGSYCGSAPTAASWLERWNGDAVLITALVLAAGTMMALRGGERRAGLIAIAILAIVFVSPLCALSVALFSMRTLHHLLLIGVAAPLLAVAATISSAMLQAPPDIGFFEANRSSSRKVNRKAIQALKKSKTSTADRPMADDWGR